MSSKSSTSSTISVTASAMVSRSENWGLDLGYDFNDIFSQTNICFKLTGAPLPPGSSACPLALPTQATQAISFYNVDTHFGYFDLMWKPIPRMTASLGYAISNTAGDTLILSPNAPAGPLQYNYHKPFAGLAFDLARNVILKGNWNTGKDLIAHAIHYESYRRDRPFFAINCAAIPETLMESELFGHEKGAFTDARAQKKGMFEMADGGSLFLT
jgi:hypothetical protein